MICAACTDDQDRVRAKGQINGHVIDTTVDSRVAKYYLENYLTGTDRDPALDQTLSSALARLPEGVPERQDFQALSETFSVDLATLHLIKVLSEIPENSRLQGIFWRETDRLRAITTENTAQLRACVARLNLPTVLFVPGWFYETDPETGGDFARQRMLFDKLGVDNVLIRTLENGTVEQNAEIIADHLRRFVNAANGVMLVSASKGGPDAAHALGRVLKPEETVAIKAWINVGGILKGTPLADWARAWPWRWVAWISFLLRGHDVGESVASMTTERSRARWKHETIPRHVQIFNFVGIPLSGHVSEDADFGYSKTKHAGPTDGLTAILDELAHGGSAIVQVGLDHYYRDPDLDLKTVALTFTVWAEIGEPVPTGCYTEAAIIQR